jgi:hypothetical protein
MLPQFQPIEQPFPRERVEKRWGKMTDDEYAAYCTHFKQLQKDSAAMEAKFRMEQDAQLLGASQQ